MRFSNKTVLVTGASRGIGYATAAAFAREGAFVVLNYLDSHDEAALSRQRILELGGGCLAYAADVADQARVLDMIGNIMRERQRIDILINNAGINRDRSAAKMSLAEWDEVLSVNLRGVFNCTRAVLPSMIEQQSGSIVSVASVVGLAGNFGQTNYAASKAGVIGFTRSLAREVAHKGIRVNAVAPGFIETGMLKGIPAQTLDAIRAQTLLRRLGKPEEIAECILFLASDAASYITGEVLNVNGGYYLH